MAPVGFGDRVEGLHAVSAAAGAGRVRELWVESHRLVRPEYSDLADEVRSRGGQVRETADVLERAESAAPQGVVAVCEPKQSSTLEHLTSLKTPAAVVVLDHLLDPQNVGAIARSAAGAGFAGLVVSVRRSAPLSASAFKAAAGAFESLAVAQVNSIADAVARLQKLGLWGIGLEAGAPAHLWDQPLLTEPLALVVGEEGSGLSRLVGERLDLVVSIPLAPGTESLNVSVATALAVFEVARQRR